ncbi:HSP 40 like protein [Gracilaria domingensis]|nr:HSP 40 like protein [Gracilaria domingensis]
MPSKSQWATRRRLVRSFFISKYHRGYRWYAGSVRLAVLAPAQMSLPSVWAYQALDLPPSATRSEVRLAYKRLSLATHPDKTRDPSSRARFDLVRAAYSFLSETSLKEENQNRNVSPVITDEIEVSDMDEDDEGLYYACRCGGLFRIEPEQMYTALASASGEDGVAVSCDGCSLAIKVSTNG